MNTMMRALLIFVLFLCQHVFAQSFKVGTIDIYGNRKLSTETILAHFKIKEGDSISHENFKATDEATRLKEIPGVKHVAISPVCCDTAGNLMMYVGIGENDSVILQYRASPKHHIKLSAAMMTAYRNAIIETEAAIINGQGDEDDSRGYALLNYKPARNEQLKFVGFANRHFALLANVLKTSADEEQRAAAAEIIAYGNDKKKITDLLLYAVDDPGEEVRNNATRALGILAGYARQHPALKINIPAATFIKMINSIVWTDRNKGAAVLVQLTSDRNPLLLNKVKQQALPSIIEMANWKDRAHAFFSFMILGRIAGETEESLITRNYSKDWVDQVKRMVEILDKQ